MSDISKTSIEIEGLDVPCYSVNTLIIGSGAASLNAAVQLYRQGQRDVLIVTDQWGGGTSNNTGSDKQTYYKLSLAGKMPDSIGEMAGDLFKGGCMHGDIALCEAQNSARAFYNLVQLGVPFPHDHYGGFIGYKTDHDPRARATSAGPLTSQQMFACLAREIKGCEIPVLDGHQIIALLYSDTAERSVVGAVGLDMEHLDNAQSGLVIFKAVNIILGTGGPAGMYKTSVYPACQTGMSGMAYAIGAVGQNLTESQYGLASIKFRWNLSGSFQQVIPRYISTDQECGDEQEFLNGYFPDMGTLATATFLKGYQWPFDPRKVKNYGSSLIDILVYQEIAHRNRRVFMDFRKSPTGGGVLDAFTLEQLNSEAYEYLKKSDALSDTPIQRLAKMNQPAIDLYHHNGIDLSKELLEIAVCAQHNNGGLRANHWWESNIKHLFPVGEVCGTHGVYRPGGSALNSGQVGGLRAASYIAKRYQGNAPDNAEFLTHVGPQISGLISKIKDMLTNESGDYEYQSELIDIQKRMSSAGAHIRSLRTASSAAEEARIQYQQMRSRIHVMAPSDLPAAFRTLDICLTHWVYLEAIRAYLANGGKSRGSYLVMEGKGEKPVPELGDNWAFSLEGSNEGENRILETYIENDALLHRWVDVRPIPVSDQWFETVWNDYLQDNVIQ